MTRIEPAPSDAERTAPGDGDDERPLLESRWRRLVAYCRHNGERICRDTAVVIAWAVVMTIWIRGFGVPRWLCYVVTFAGVVGYAFATTPWSRPYRSPDDLEGVSTDGQLQESQ